MKVPRSCVRTKKLTNTRSMQKCDGHNRRTEEVPHADPNRQSLRLHGENQPLEELIEARIETSGATVKRNSVKAVELVLTTSPEYFRPGNPAEWGRYNQEAMEKWRDATMEFLFKKYGDNLIAVDLHLDEATPHIHAVVTPLAEKTRKKRQGKKQKAAGEPAQYYTASVLDAKNMFGKTELSNLQTEFADALKDLNIFRGMKGSKRRHETTGEWYKISQNDQIPQLPEVEMPAVSEKHPNPYEYIKRLEQENKQLRGVIKRLMKSADKTIKDLVTKAEDYLRRFIQQQKTATRYWMKFDNPNEVFDQLNEKDAKITQQDQAISELAMHNGALKTQLKLLAPDPTPDPAPQAQKSARQRSNNRDRDNDMAP